MLSSQNNDLNTATENSNKIECTKEGCMGKYYGVEFINGSDVAHQFSNTMSTKVGDILKELYDKGEYVKVDFSTIKMATLGMGSGIVSYELSIPFVRVREKCDAFTSFDHVGGWDHKPSLLLRKTELSMVLMQGESLDISALKTTPEGLQEYWIQWKNKIKQADCSTKK